MYPMPPEQMQGVSNWWSGNSSSERHILQIAYSLCAISAAAGLTVVGYSSFSSSSSAIFGGTNEKLAAASPSIESFMLTVYYPSDAIDILVLYFESLLAKLRAPVSPSSLSAPYCPEPSNCEVAWIFTLSFDDLPFNPPLFKSLSLVSRCSSLTLNLTLPNLTTSPKPTTTRLSDPFHFLLRSCIYRILSVSINLS